MFIAAALLALSAAPALAQAAAGDTASGRIVQTFALLTVLSLAPILLVVATSFTRFLIVFSFLRSGLGLQGAPANLALIALSLFMTVYVMAPTFDQAWSEGVQPYLENRISEKQAFDAAIKPFRGFMLSQVRDRDLKLFSDLAVDSLKVEDRASADLRVLAPAFMISELRRGFEIGFLIVLPFLVIDMIVAIVVMSMGMMMLPPSVLSLPLKVMFFVLIDGWNLLAGSLVRSYG
ncbi:MAG: flagellar type III secretion system pore protein FliP [Methylobacteriaceae bacterium]|nr:flagellar type III secretion system pore protein FliP [Methylobacteriaceae bacterium]